MGIVLKEKSLIPEEKASLFKTSAVFAHMNAPVLRRLAAFSMRAYLLHVLHTALSVESTPTAGSQNFQVTSIRLVTPGEWRAELSRLFLTAVR